MQPRRRSSRLSTPARTLFVVSGFSAAAVLSCLAVLFLERPASNRDQGKGFASQVSAAAPQLFMEDISIYIHADSAERHRLTADRMLLQRKKVGFFRFGLLKELVFDNAGIVIHRERRAAAGMGGGEEAPGPFSGKDADAAGFAGTPAGLLSLLHAGRVGDVLLRQVRIDFVEDGGRSTVTASAAAMREDGSGMELAGGVTVVAGIRRLSASALTLDVGRAIVTGKGECLLQDGVTSRRLQPCRADVFLGE